MAPGRWLIDKELANGCHRLSRDELTKWTLGADKVLVFWSADQFLTN